MRTVKLYHGTSASNLISVMDFPNASPSINGLGFYLTPDKDIASQYGSNVICYVISVEDYDEINPIIRPIDQSYIDGIRTYEQCLVCGVEVVLTQHDADMLAVNCVTSYVAH
tara:strand:- start:942 stop:1277 length:336 start_codon:yes stop_codon:yes gene_type:complete